jgi:hypothetical protein
MKKTIGLVFIVFTFALCLLTASFLWLDFRLARSSTKVNVQAGTFSIGIENGGKLDPLDQLAIYVKGEDGFTAAVRQETINKLDADPKFGNVTSLEKSLDQSDQPILYVETRDRSIFWTPFFSRSSMTVYLAYATDGDISWRGKNYTVMHMQVSPAVRVESTYQVNDTTLGLVSRKAYQHFLAGQIAIKISQTLGGSFTNPPMSESQGTWSETTTQK